MMNVSGTKEDYEPGDLLAIGPDGKLVKTNAPYASSPQSALSTKPGFVGDTEIAESGINGYENRTNADRVPVAILGIVPTKVSAENEPSCRGLAYNVGHSRPCHEVHGQVSVLRGDTRQSAGALAFGTGVMKVLVTLR